MPGDSMSIDDDHSDEDLLYHDHMNVRDSFSNSHPYANQSKVGVFVRFVRRVLTAAQDIVRRDDRKSEAVSV